MYSGHEFGWMNGGVFGFPFGIILIIAVVWIIIYTASKAKSQKEETPLDILKRRYANGEINKEDFERIKKDIS